MKLEINITKGKFWVITTLLVLAISVFVFAAKPNPGHSAGEVEGTVPSGFCVFSAEKNNCPNGFVPLSEKFKDRTIREGTFVGVGELGGFASYQTDGNSWSTGGGDSNIFKLINIGKEVNEPMDNWPPYVGVLICCKE